MASLIAAPDAGRATAVAGNSFPKLHTKSLGWSRSKAKQVLGSEFATANDLEAEEGEEYVEWLLDEAERLEGLD